MHALTHRPAARPPLVSTPASGPDTALIRATHIAALAAERTAANHAAGLASTEALILASDAAFHAARRAERAAEASGCPLMAAAAERARAAYRAGAPC